MFVNATSRYIDDYCWRFDNAQKINVINAQKINVIVDASLHEQNRLK